MAAGTPARGALTRTLHHLARSTVPGSRCGHFAGLSQRRLAALSPGRLQQAWQHGTLCSGRPSCTAAAAATDVERAAAAGGEEEPRYQSAAYPFTEIEAKWQAFWEQHKTFRTPDFKDLDTSKPKFYALDMFPYPRWFVHSILPAQSVPRFQLSKSDCS